MINIGKFNHLYVTRASVYGAYLSDKERSTEVLLPMRYCDPMPALGDRLKVFVYTDSEYRPVATTVIPYATVGEFAFLQVTDVNRIGAFLDWGLEGKNLLCPFSEQRSRMYKGGIYLVYVALDHATRRVVASAKIEKYLGNVIPEYRRGNKVRCLVIERTAIGYKVIVDNLHKGMIYDSELFRPLEIQQTVAAYVKNIRPDGKIDLTMTAPSTEGRVLALEKKILEGLRRGNLGLGDRSTPEEIKERLQCSKKDFKKTVGKLYKDRVIAIDSEGALSLVENKKRDKNI